MDALTRYSIRHGVTEFSCEKCGKPLDPETLVWLELNCLTLEYAEPGAASWSETPQSQGCFPFGADCAKRLLKRGRP
jgi:hypothetical protein